MEIQFQQQLKILPESGFFAILSHRTDLPLLVKERVLFETRLGANLGTLHAEYRWQRDLFEADIIDVGIVLVPVRAMCTALPADVCCYEAELDNLLRHGRGIPAVPLVLIGVAPA